MSRRKLLILAITACGIVGIAAFIDVLISSLRPSAQALDDAEVVLDLAPITPGEVQTFNIHGRPLFVLRPDESQRQNISN